MRRILVEQARRKKRIRHGGKMNRVEMADPAESFSGLHQRMVEVDAALTRLSREDPLSAEVVKLHYFAGLSLGEVAKLLRLSRATTYRQWTYARSWLKVEIEASS
jgi:RNA polymerase sigma factor (TIGR02999 family)